jgi:hypothetical protein
MSMKSVLLSVAALSFLFCGSLRAQDDGEQVFGQIHEYLKGDIKARTFSSPLLFVGEITGLGPVFDGVCKSAVGQTVDFAVRELLLGDLSGDTFHSSYANCTRQPLPSPPFTLHAQVILYCHPDKVCFHPVPATAERVNMIREWMGEARRPEGDVAFAELRRAIKKASPLAPQRDFIFEGEIASIETIGKPVCLIALRRKVEINVVKVLFGEAPVGPIETGYGSSNCPIPTPLSVRLHAKVIVYCESKLYMPQICLTPVEDSPRRLAAVSAWIAASQNPSGAPGAVNP